MCRYDTDIEKINTIRAKKKTSSEANASLNECKGVCVRSPQTATLDVFTQC